MLLKSGFTIALLVGMMSVLSAAEAPQKSIDTSTDTPKESKEYMKMVMEANEGRATVTSKDVPTEKGDQK